MFSNNQKNLKNVYGSHKNIPHELVLKMHKFALDLKKKGYGQRTIAREIQNVFRVNLSENTVSGWIHRHTIPFTNEKTQFKPKPIPPKKELYDFYLKKKTSASRLGQKYKVSTITAINWLVNHGIKVRTHTESMNTPHIKKELSELRLTKPTKDYMNLTPEKAYILGVLCGDAYIDNNFVKLEIRKDIDFMEEFLRCFKKVYGLDYTYYYYKPRNSYISNVNSKIICKDLLSYGKFRTKDWFVPQCIQDSGSMKIKSSFLRGIYDSEGHVAKDRIDFTSLSRRGIRTSSNLLNQLGIKHRIYKYKRYFTLGIYRKEHRSIFKKLIGFTIKRKMERLK